MNNSSRVPRNALRMLAVAGRRYASPAQLEQLYPYSKYSWRNWYYAGKLRDCLKPAGKKGRLLIPLDEAERVMKEGFGETPAAEGK